MDPFIDASLQDAHHEKITTDRIAIIRAVEAAHGWCDPDGKCDHE